MQGLNVCNVITLSCAGVEIVTCGVSPFINYREGGGSHPASHPPTHTHPCVRDRSLITGRGGGSHPASHPPTHTHPCVRDRSLITGRGGGFTPRVTSTHSHPPLCKGPVINYREGGGSHPASHPPTHTHPCVRDRSLITGRGGVHTPRHIHPLTPTPV